MAENINLPEGFIVDSPLPQGFVLDEQEASPPAAPQQAPQPVQQAAPQPAPFLDPFAQALFGLGDAPTHGQAMPEFLTGAERQTEATRALPEIGEIKLEDMGQEMRIAAGLLSATDPGDQIAIIKQTVPEAQVSADEKGNIIVDFGGGKRAILNKPGASPQDLLNMTAQVLSFIPAARITSFGKNLLQKLGLGVTTAAATEAGLQEASVALGAEEARRPERVALAGLLGGAAETVLPAIQSIRQARQARQIGAPPEEFSEIARAAEEVRPATEATGVELFPAQQTQAAEALLEQRLVSQLPAGSRKAAQALRKQNEQSAAAVNDFLDQIAPPEAVITGPAKFRTAAQNAVERAKNIRRERTSKIYNGAFKKGADIDLKPVNDLIEGKLADLPESGEIFKSVTKVQKLIGDKPSLKKLHNAKLEIDQMMNKVGENSLGNTTKNELRGIKEQLLTQMDEGSELYRLARRSFELQSPPVTQIQDSIIGNIAKMDDTQLKRISQRVFDPAETNPQVIIQAKKLINDVDPDAWNQLLRSEIERRMGGLKAGVSAETVENVPGQIHRVLFGNEKSRRILFKSVDGETAKNMKYLETVLKRASTGRAPGSPTIPFAEIRDRLNKGALRSIRDAFRNPIQTFAATGEEAQLNRVIKKLSDAVFDPQWKPQMTKLRKLDPNSPAAARAMAQLLKGEEE